MKYRKNNNLRSSPSVVELLDRLGRKRTNSGDIETDSVKAPR